MFYTTTSQQGNTVTHETTLWRYACSYHFSRFSARRGVGSIRAFVFTCCVVCLCCVFVGVCFYSRPSVREIRLVAVIFANLESPSVRFPVLVRFLLPLLLLLPFILLLLLSCSSGNLLLLSCSSGNSCIAHGTSHIMFLIIS